MAPGVRWDRTGGEADGSGVIGDVEKVVGEDVFGGRGTRQEPDLMQAFITGRAEQGTTRRTVIRRQSGDHKAISYLATKWQLRQACGAQARKTPSTDASPIMCPSPMSGTM